MYKLYSFAVNILQEHGQKKEFNCLETFYKERLMRLRLSNEKAPSKRLRMADSSSDDDDE